MVRLLGFANGALLASAIGLLATVLLAYPYASALPMAGQIVAPIGTLIFATGIKIFLYRSVGVAEATGKTRSLMTGRIATGFAGAGGRRCR